MARDPRYDILFETVPIGPLTAKNRFIQTPHCSGMGHTRPKAMAEMRRIKAQGGWAIVCTEATEIHPNSEHTPESVARLWDDGDIPALALAADAIHEHGALAGIELEHSGYYPANHYSRLAPMAASNLCVDSYAPVQARAMDLEDFRELRDWHRTAALRSKQAGFDVIYIYAARPFALPGQLISRRFNDRTDEYGGAIENRARLIRELIDDTKDAVGDCCAIAVRFSVVELQSLDADPDQETMSSEREGREVLEFLAELPDLWDVIVADWSIESATSRFADEGFQEKYISFVKSVTSKPVVGVGRFTSPDTMVSQVSRGVLDFIGAARPSIADPFLPKKIEEGRADEIRECIGCNVCVSTDLVNAPLRCTQNPTMGEEWRRGWHPEEIRAKRSDDPILVVGAGPAGLEFALALTRRGYEVTIADAGEEPGGRVTAESRLPGLAAWSRVRDYRTYLLSQMANANLYVGSHLEVGEIKSFEIPHVVLATGASWRRDGVGRCHSEPIPGLDILPIFTPNDIFAGHLPEGEVLVYDDDHYYLGGVIAEKLVRDGRTVTLVTPAPMVSAWTEFTLEQKHIQKKILDLGITAICANDIAGIEGRGVELSCVYSGARREVACESLVLVTSRQPDDDLYRAYRDDTSGWHEAGIRTLQCIGDCLAPGTIAAAVHSGHLAAREIEEETEETAPFSREYVAL